MRGRLRARSRDITVSAGLAGAAAVLVLVGTPVSFGKLTAAITNSTNTSVSAGYFTCTAAVVGGGAYSAWPLNDLLPVTANDVSGNNHTGGYSVLGVTTQVAGPCPRDSAKAATFNGTNGSVADSTGVTATASQSNEIWFKTTTTAGGLLIGSYTSATAGTGDRVLYMTSSGQLVFGVNPGTVKTITSPSSYNDGAWHLADGVLSSSGGASLYVDGTLVASSATITSAGTGTEFTRVAAGTLTGWPNLGGGTTAAAAFSGSLAYASIYRTAISAGQVAGAYRAGH